MSDRDEPSWEELKKGHIPHEDYEDHGVRGGYQPETSEGGPPPSGGGGGKEPQKDDD